MVDASPPAWAPAVSALQQLQAATELVSVLQAASRHGVLDALVGTASVDHLAQQLGQPSSRVEALLGVLRAHGVAAATDGGWGLSPPWASVVTGESPFPLDALLGWVRIRGEQLAASLDGADDYWRLSAQDRLLFARGSSFDPTKEAGRVMVRQDLTPLPSVLAALDGGGAVLELGCGVASRLTATLLAFPDATAVGVELAADLAEFARSRAAGLGVAERLEVVVGDATTYPAEPVFDLVQWSQFFFSATTRAGALATARRALKPGGWISCPAVLRDPPEPGTDDDKELAAERLALDLWDIPLRSAGELVAELEDAGFADVVVHSSPFIHFVRGRQP